MLPTLGGDGVNGPTSPLTSRLNAVNRAIALNARNGLAHSIKAEALWMRQELDAALVESQRALDLNPNDAWALATLGGLLLHTGNPAAAIEHIELAFQLNPHPPSWAFANLGMAYYLLDRDDDAVGVLTRGISAVKEDPSPHAILAMAAHRAGQNQLAERARTKALRTIAFF